LTDKICFSPSEAKELARSMLVRKGASAAMAEALAVATVGAEARGIKSNGFAHLKDYVDAMEAGRLDPQALPTITSPLPAAIMADANGGVTHLAFAQALDQIVEKANTYGMAMFACKGAFTTGELGYYTWSLAERGLVALAATNGPPLLAVPGASKATYCTNPVSFAAPRAGQMPLLIDQASSATAYVNLRMAAARGDTIPEGWAIDEDGQSTTDAKSALKGALLSYGGARGGTMALMVEILAAGMSGANWSLDCPDFRSGSESPGCGLFVLALSPVIAGGDFAARMASQSARLSEIGVHVPGDSKSQMMTSAETDGIFLDAGLVATLTT